MEASQYLCYLLPETPSQWEEIWRGSSGLISKVCDSDLQFLLLLMVIWYGANPAVFKISRDLIPLGTVGDKITK